MSADIASGDKPAADTTLERAVLGHLRKAEREIVWLRWLGMIGWAFILWRGPAADVSWPWLVYAGGLAYTAFAHWRIAGTGSVLSIARMTTVGDPVLVTLMCIVTGGLSSPFFPFYYFTLLAAAFRFGWRETLGLLVLTIFLSVFLYLVAPVESPGLSALAIGIFYLAFSAALGVLLARWAQENLDLALDRARALSFARDRARSLLRRLIRTQEEERRLIAGDLHDRMSGHLFALRQGADRAQDRALSDTVDGISRDIRALMNELHPTVLDDLGIAVAMEEYVAAQRESAPFKISLDIAPELRHWRSSTDAMLFRILQEALLNIRKHARASQVSIALTPEPGGGARLRIEDDGCGFDPALARPGHFGLLTMRERAEALGGTLAVSSAPAQGTALVVTLPGEAGREKNHNLSDR
ncbi:sensor histidine kinase [Parvibaculum sp.]|jgi:signal transduction histidine kinase|uniref:sensor histidine kinase n=1 Tax=Parvibaculum sp. TaxID=2024848 RepID=UPI001B15FA05|nr:sensor histidine kinase [Parvibaculum sp.]MBO6634918.1 sensor histidine kinase [Parvibaculum sp.]MBO6678830.1 sensor histidine kinase [Parvibaculum sp.]MBO6683760.1 sensor histidine kinase [Parvibaculum sp.]